ncbi:MAG TPA: hypothetical protein VMU43_01015 [Candidatus Acidoferrum sp.]|nr:hypothetical protein [Candidatus Acidoferrum sp.]
MKKRIVLWLPIWAIAISCPAALANGRPKKAAQQSAQSSQSSQSPDAHTQAKNLQEYINLMRSNVRDQKAEIMGSVMELNIEDSAKFWPIYNEYDAELTKLNDLRIANIKDYAANYSQMTDDKADELVHNALDYQKQRGQLLAKYYEIMKQSLGAVTAARFLQVEDQLLLIIDLQIVSSLPIVSQ